MFQKYMEKDFHSTRNPLVELQDVFHSVFYLLRREVTTSEPSITSTAHPSRSGLLLHTSSCILCRGCSFRYWWLGPVSSESRGIFSPLHIHLCHPAIYKTLILCKMLDSNQRPIVYQTIALPCELISLQAVDLLDVSLWERG